MCGAYLNLWIHELSASNCAPISRNLPIPPALIPLYLTDEAPFNNLFHQILESNVLRNFKERFDILNAYV